MRKKSHISLTKGVVHGLSAEQRFGHRLSLYVGSILPDCTPSFLTRRHCIEDTFDVCEKKMLGFLKHYKTKKKGVSILSSIRMGVVLHYIADYFTYPHNAHYPGTLKDHCSSVCASISLVFLYEVSPLIVSRRFWRDAVR